MISAILGVELAILLVAVSIGLALLADVVLLVSAVTTTVLAVVCSFFLIWLYIDMTVLFSNSMRILRGYPPRSVLQARKLLFLAVLLLVTCVSTLMCIVLWTQVHSGEQNIYISLPSSFDQSMLTRYVHSVCVVIILFVLGGFSSLGLPATVSSEAVLSYIQLLMIVFDLLVVPVVVSFLTVAVDGIKKRANKTPVPQTQQWLGFLTDINPLKVGLVFLLVGVFAPAMLWEFDALGGAVLSLGWAVIVSVWLYELLFNRVWLSLLYQGKSRPLMNGGSALDTVAEWIEPAVLSLVGGWLLVYLTAAAALMLETWLHPDRTESRLFSRMQLDDIRLVTSVRLAFYSVIVQGSGGFGRYEPTDIWSALVLCALLLMIKAVRVAFYSIAVSSGLAAVASASSRSKTPATAAQS